MIFYNKISCGTRTMKWMTQTVLGNFIIKDHFAENVNALIYS